MQELRCATDQVLVDVVRSGDGTGFTELWRRYGPVVRELTLGAEARHRDDVESEVFVRSHHLMRADAVPASAQGLIVATAYRTLDLWRRPRPDVPLDEVSSILSDADREAWTGFHHDELWLGAVAFDSLSERWRAVLLLADVEGHKPQAVAPGLGMSTGSFSALAHRARDGLHQAWIREHRARHPTAEGEHRWARANLARYLRHRDARAPRARVGEHLGRCSTCRSTVAAATGSVRMRAT
ncbi:DNA-directed RNA polymerase specialized sigma24 family protein [Curtobacterium pusillum]|uniref:DNA-directed RNA polymerase specialized sigma24 family protein n=1 Tax=Curtobacterium pusillum TaxID=69373 RepID=A0AAW3T313_9MICO|nr:sigma-70 family RNA polymerase sigma factor [Curtobacterium pusillum]MBA8989696.1 DNA-directed RNA polymerase specialized sigma24 family protein [Curtobacterium pusillum]